MDATALADQFLFNESSNESEIGSVTISYLFSIFASTLSFIITCGNLLVIFSIIYFKQLHSPTNFLMVSLAVADLFVGLFLLPFSITIFMSSNVSSQDFLCKLRNSLDIFLCSTSISSLCCIAVDRYYAVCQPLSYRSKINVRVIGIMILVSWSVAAFTGIVFTFRAPNKQEENERCALFQNKAQNTVVVGAVFCLFGIPSILMVAIYLKILVVAQRQARSIVNTSKSGANVNKMERKATKTLAIVMGVFLVSWTPFFLCVSFYPVSKYSIPLHVIQLSKWLGWSNSMYNPCVYAFFYKHFRLAFRIIITGNIFQGEFKHSKLF